MVAIVVFAVVALFMTKAVALAAVVTYSFVT